MSYKEKLIIKLVVVVVICIAIPVLFPKLWFLDLFIILEVFLAEMRSHYSQIAEHGDINEDEFTSVSYDKKEEEEPSVKEDKSKRNKKK